MAEDAPQSVLTDTQDKVLSLVPLFTGALSIWGSSNIISMVLTSEKRTSYRRILLGMSCYDVISSLLLMLQPFLMPSGTAVWAIGNEASCNALGFFFQFVTSDIWYNAVLSFYFLLTVRYSVGEPEFAKRYEPWMHGVSIGWPLITASLGAGFGVYDSLAVGHGCYVANYPEGCGCLEEGQEDNQCCYSPLIAWIILGVPATLLFLAVLINNILVYCHVRSTLLKSMAYVQQYTTPKDRPKDRPSLKKKAQEDPMVNRIVAVATQAFLYVGAFLISTIWTYSLRIWEGASSRDSHSHENGYFPLLVMQAIFKPLQGFLNVFVFARPSYIKARDAHPRESRLWAFRRALHGDKIKPTQPLRTTAVSTQIGGVTDGD